ncbi:hypothetical protein E2493_10915 [Sphingomonas parva]|uniref:Uncharacterized protein n=1 Tax=Sphingomonas parva TaxID=2555898 RepID=A0A4Y8ZQJ6_9SPHN|nr:hypothetical protein [Sphingomonas parva]TFI58291.1 hypothetical protein E2493_10915 [Sphingomonas parva]
MIAAVFRGLIQKEIRMDQGGKCLRRRLQDTSRTPFHRKTVGFLWLHMGASGGARAARKEKASKNNAPNGTIAGFRRETARP